MNNDNFSFHFYPIIDSISWLEILIQNKVPLSQYRVKKTPSQLLENEIKQAIALAQKHNHCLIINDYWQLALKYNAYGIHLGYEDSQQADLKKIKDKHLVLGLSTHDNEELQYAIEKKPTYIALGPIFPTTTKKMRFSPQGLEKIALWREKIPQNIKLVAIGGISLSQSADIYKYGANCISVVSDIAKASNPHERLQQWLMCQI